MDWWRASGEKPEGPFPAEHVTEWLKSGLIAPDTMACPEGGQEWKRLEEINEFAQLVPPSPPRSEGPPPPPPGAPPQAAPAIMSGLAGNSRAKFGILTAAIVRSGCALAWELITIDDPVVEFTLLDLLGFCIAVVAIITWAMFHYHLWGLLPSQYADTTPGKAVGFLFIPFYNCYWVFRSFVGVNRGLNRLADAHQLSGSRANLGLAVANGVFFVVAWFFFLAGLWLPSFEGLDNPYAFYSPYAQQAAYEAAAEAHVAYNAFLFLLCSAPSFVLWLLMVLNQKRMVEHLLKSGAPLNTASGLIDR